MKQEDAGMGAGAARTHALVPSVRGDDVPRARRHAERGELGFDAREERRGGKPKQKASQHPRFEGRCRVADEERERGEGVQASCALAACLAALPST
jgi:hypothetical protein